MHAPFLKLKQVILTSLRRCRWCRRCSKPGVSLPLLRYIVDYESDDRVPEPAPRVLPAQFKKNPHEFVKLLNKGQMPYVKNSSYLLPGTLLRMLPCHVIASSLSP